jgi:hypothetical protein
MAFSPKSRYWSKVNLAESKPKEFMKSAASWFLYLVTPILSKSTAREYPIWISFSMVLLGLLLTQYLRMKVRNLIVSSI